MNVYVQISRDVKHTDPRLFRQLGREVRTEIILHKTRRVAEGRAVVGVSDGTLPRNQDSVIIRTEVQCITRRRELIGT